MPSDPADQRLSSYVFDLPEAFIAQRPVEPRHAARLLAVDPAEPAGCRHLTVWDLQHQLRAGDLLVVNNTRVLKARLQVRRASGGQVELLVLEPVAGSDWLCLARPAKRLKPGELLQLEHPGQPAETITLQPNAKHHLRFPAGTAGTYLYYARTPNGRRGANRVIDALLGGALVIDAPGPTPANDRIFVLERWNGPTRTAINGKSWPYTERLNFQVGETVHWKIVNASDLSHPMHLHGIPQLVIAKDGNPVQPHFEDTITIAPGERWTVLVKPDASFLDHSSKPYLPALGAGVWAFHCHILNHAERNNGMFGMVTTFIVLPEGTL